MDYDIGSGKLNGPAMTLLSSHCEPDSLDAKAIVPTCKTTGTPVVMIRDAIACAIAMLCDEMKESNSSLAVGRRRGVGHHKHAVAVIAEPVVALPRAVCHFGPR